jgi:hypothetical protein
MSIDNELFLGIEPPSETELTPGLSRRQKFMTAALYSGQALVVLGALKPLADPVLDHLLK